MQSRPEQHLSTDTIIPDRIKYLAESPEKSTCLSHVALSNDTHSDLLFILAASKCWNTMTDTAMWRHVSFCQNDECRKQSRILSLISWTLFKTTKVTEPQFNTNGFSGIRFLAIQIHTASKPVTLHNMKNIVRHSEDRASWYIRIIEANKLHYFSTLFWYTTLHVLDRVSITRNLDTVFTASN
jgi:hypothetical protein